MGILKAINSEFGSVCSVSVCNFHFMQALLRQAGFKGCKKLLNDDPTFKTAFDMLKALAYVPVLHVIQVHESVVVPFWKKHKFHQGKSGKLLEYFENTYIGKETKSFRKPRCFL